MNVPACDHTQNGPAPNRRFFLVKCRQCSYEQKLTCGKSSPVEREGSLSSSETHIQLLHIVYPCVLTSEFSFSDFWSGHIH